MDVDNVVDFDFLELGTPTEESVPNSEEPQVEDNDQIGQVEEQEVDQETPETDTEEQEEIDESSEAGENIDEPSTEDTEDSVEGDTSLYQSLIESSGLEFSEEELSELLETEETEEGFNKVSSYIAEKKAEDRFMALMEQYPETAKMLNYEMNGGDPKEYFNNAFPEVDYSKVSIDKEDVQSQKQVVAQTLKLQGLDDEDIKAELDDLETGGILYNRANRSLKILQANQQREREKFEQKQQELVQQRQQQAKEQFNKTKEIIESGSISGIKIPKSKANDFMKYIYDSVDESGVSQAAIDAQNIDLEQRLMIAYLQYSEFKLDDFIKQQAKNSNVKSIRDMLDKSKTDKLKSSGKQDTTRKSGSIDDIDSPFI